MSASSWLDDYFSWIEPNRENSCCRIKYKRNETCFRTTVMPPNSTNTTTPAPAVICYNETTPVVPYVFCNATGECCKAEVNLFHSPVLRKNAFTSDNAPLSTHKFFRNANNPFPLPPQ